MRNLKKLVQMLVVAALLAVPVAAISAQSGTANNGYGWDGASDWPGVTHIIVTPDDESAPSMLPDTGSNKISEPAIRDWRYEGFTLVPEWADPVRRESAPEMGYDEASALRDAYAQLRSTGEVSPAALPTTGGSAQESMTIEGFFWDGQAYVPDVVSGPPSTLPETGYDEASALREAYAQLRFTGEVQPANLPATGMVPGLAGRDQQVILDQIAAGSGATARVWNGNLEQRAVNLDGISGRDRQTIIDQLAAVGVSVMITQPAALPQTGHSAAGASAPSDPPLIGDWARTGEDAAAQAATPTPSDPPLLDVAGLR